MTAQRTQQAEGASLEVAYREGDAGDGMRLGTLRMPAAALGAPSPLFPVRTTAANTVTPANAELSEDDGRYIGYGALTHCLPYQMLDDYDRQRRPRDFRVAVLENRTLRATFLLELGGRLWSLYHKPTGRELLHVNPVFQPANLAVRNAWFSGGVEWNFGVPGHSPFTCDPLFAARLTDERGTPVLRLYEWERIRRMAYQIDAYLPADSPVLLVRVRLVNPHAHEVPVYWWSNIAACEYPGGRTLVPASTAYSFGYAGRMRLYPIPYVDGCDLSYPQNSGHAADFFYRVQTPAQPWIASVDTAGRGMFQTSTPRLRGRKMFVWGNNAGGQHWQDFLSVPGERYVEIQAGLARTQSECLPMPAGAEWSWLEAYGPLELDPAVVHHHDWSVATGAVADAVAQTVPAAELEAEHERTRKLATVASHDLIQQGSGWGTLEALRCRSNGAVLVPEHLVFPESALGEAQAPWCELLRQGRLAEPAPDQPPGSYMVQDQWRQMLEASVHAGHSDHWAGWLHLGVMYLAQGRTDDARRAWQRSLEHQPNAWAWRNLGTLAKADKDWPTAAHCYEQALPLAPDKIHLLTESAAVLLAAERAPWWLDHLRRLPAAMRAHGRVRLLEAKAALAVNDFSRARQIICSNDLVVSDVRECETSLSDLWFELHERMVAQQRGVAIDDALRQYVRQTYPCPPELDFRMTRS